MYIVRFRQLQSCGCKILSFWSSDKYCEHKADMIFSSSYFWSSNDPSTKNEDRTSSPKEIVILNAFKNMLVNILKMFIWPKSPSGLQKQRKAQTNFVFFFLPDCGQGEGRPWHSSWDPQWQGRVEGKFISLTLFSMFTLGAGNARSFFKIFFKLIMIFFKVEKEKDGATIKSKKNAEGRKVRLNISALVALFYPCGGGT